MRKVDAMPQREYLSEQISREAWDAFDKWCREYDPEGNMDTIDLVAAYEEACTLSYRCITADEEKPLK